MKILSIAVPCYNSAAYMDKCINSLLKGKEDVEIIIVNDGSTKDNTKEIADEYALKYPSIIKVVHQENGGHGQAVNTGLKNSTGEYFKVVDSDDWVDEDAYVKILDTLKAMIEKETKLDLLLSNFVYEKQGAKHKKVMKYKSAIKPNTLLSWEDDVNFKKPQYILMHSVIYRTELLRECDLELPKHTFYVDNIFVYKPLPYVKSMYYLDVDFYRYFIGRDDQSVNEKVMISRIDQQIKVSKIIIDIYNKENIKNSKLDKYMLQYLDMMMCVSSIMLILSGTKENLDKKKELWLHLKKENISLYKKIRLSILGIWMNLPGFVGRGLSKLGYRVAQKMFGFN